MTFTLMDRLNSVASVQDREELDFLYSIGRSVISPFAIDIQTDAKAVLDVFYERVDDTTKKLITYMNEHPTDQISPSYIDGIRKNIDELTLRVIRPTKLETAISELHKRFSEPMTAKDISIASQDEIVYISQDDIVKFPDLSSYLNTLLERKNGELGHGFKLIAEPDPANESFSEQIKKYSAIISLEDPKGNKNLLSTVYYFGKDGVTAFEHEQYRGQQVLSFRNYSKLVTAEPFESLQECLNFGHTAKSADILGFEIGGNDMYMVSKRGVDTSQYILGNPQHVIINPGTMNTRYLVKLMARAAYNMAHTVKSGDGESALLTKMTGFKEIDDKAIEPFISYNKRPFKVWLYDLMHGTDSRVVTNVDLYEHRFDGQHLRLNLKRLENGSYSMYGADVFERDVGSIRELFGTVKGDIHYDSLGLPSQ